MRLENSMKTFIIYQKGIGMMLGLIFGAGMFALPAAVARSGIWWGAIHFSVAFLIVAVLHLWFAEIVYASDGHERFPGFVQKWVGGRYKIIGFLTVVLGYYGALLVYGILGGIFLSILFPFLSSFWWAIIFFALGGILSLFKFEKIGMINFYLTIPLILFVVILIGRAFLHIDAANFNVGSSAFWFLPYGVFIFSFSGLAAIPETRDILQNRPIRDLQKVIIISMIIAAVLYAFFIASVIGVSGVYTTDDALSGLANIIGKNVMIVGAIIGFLAVFTSYLVIAADMKSMFHFDYRINDFLSLLITALPAPILFIAGFAELLEIVSFTGAVTLGISGIFVFLMARNLHRFLPPHGHILISSRGIFASFIVFLLLGGVALEIMMAGGIL